MKRWHEDRAGLVPPMGRKIGFVVMDLFRGADGKPVEHGVQIRTWAG